MQDTSSISKFLVCTDHPMEIQGWSCFCEAELRAHMGHIDILHRYLRLNILVILNVWEGMSVCVCWHGSHSRVKMACRDDRRECVEINFV